MTKTLAMLLAGGVGSRLNVLASLRAKPAVPFGGIYRIVDFTLSNIMNSGLNNVGILTQYKPYSLMKHVGTGVPWDLVGRKRGAKILPPKTGEKDSDWYQGTADAIYQNLSYIKSHSPEQVLILSGDHIYHMDYRAMLNFHKQNKADLTIAVREVPIENAHQFGIANTDHKNKIVSWEEKPEQPKSNLASMGIYIFNADFLIDSLENRGGHDFGKNIIPDSIYNHTVMAFPFKGYWQDVGTIQSYWDTNMDLLNPQSNLNMQEWHIRTNMEEEGHLGDRPPSYISNSAKVSNSIISSFCKIEGEVYNSVLSPGVRVARNAVIRDSVIMHDSHIGESSYLDKVIVDKNVIIDSHCKIGVGENKFPNIEFPDHLSTGITVLGKKSYIPSNVIIEKNCIINPNTTEGIIQASVIKCGGTL